MSAAEVAEMKEHLAFIRSYKDALRLKLNAAEDLLVNGRREPSERGVCRHLLGKVDLAVIERAVGREPLASEAGARARMLAGAIRLTADVGVLLAYLETLAHVRSHTEAAQAFAEVTGRIDFESLSAARLARLLQVLTDTFTGHERVQVLFSLLDLEVFRRAFDTAETGLPPPVAEVFAPLRAVHRLLHEQGTHDAPEAPALLARGLEQVLSAPDPLLRAYPERLRVRMLETTLRPEMPAALTDRAAGVLLSSLPKDGRVYARLALRRTGQLLERHVDDLAQSTLEELGRAQPGFRVAGRWLAALTAPRVGRFALTGTPGPGRLVPAFWLDGQRPVWVRTVAATAEERVRAEAALQAAAALPGVAPVVAHGCEGDTAFVAVVAAGRPLVPPSSAAAALALTATTARILHALALAGVTLPDAALARFVGGDDGSALVLADLDGATQTESHTANAANARLAAELAGTVLPATLRDGDGEVARTLRAAPTLPVLIAALDRQQLVAAPH
jgi:hypothetical protein